MEEGPEVVAELLDGKGEVIWQSSAGKVEVPAEGFIKVLKLND